jgi:hypothetical protein
MNTFATLSALVADLYTYGKSQGVAALCTTACISSLPTTSPAGDRALAVWPGLRAQVATGLFMSQNQYCKRAHVTPV